MALTLPGGAQVQDVGVTCDSLLLDGFVGVVLYPFLNIRLGVAASY